MENNFLPPSAFQHLEPQPGGKWAVVNQTADAIAISYVVNGVPENVSHTIYPCTTEEEIQVRCQAYVYEFSQTPNGPVMQLGSQISQTQVPGIGLNLPMSYGQRMSWQTPPDQGHIGEADFSQLSFCSDSTHQSPSPESNHSPQFPDVGIDAIQNPSTVLSERMDLPPNPSLPGSFFNMPNFNWVAEQNTFVSNLAPTPGEPGQDKDHLFHSKPDAPFAHWNTTWMQS